MGRDVIALTWFAHRRTKSLCDRLDWAYVVIGTSARGLMRYLSLVPRTIIFLLRRRPEILVVQSPSLVLAALCAALKTLLGYRLVVDAHNESVEPYILRGSFARSVVNWCLRRADLTIVTNHALADVVTHAGGVPAVLPDPLPEPPCSNVTPKDVVGFRVLVISTFAQDEPLKEIIEAARSLGDEYRFLVTGDVKRAPKALHMTAPDNLNFSGFMPEQQYWESLREADVIVDLTEMRNCLVCGAYEAVSLSKPLLLTEGSAARWWFGDAAMYAENSAKSIEHALREVRYDHKSWLDRATQGTVRIEGEWQRLALKLADRLLEISREERS